MTDFGMTDEGFKPKRLPEIKLDMETSARAALGGSAALLPDSVEGVLIGIFSEFYAEQWEQLHNAYGAFNPISTTGQALDDLVLINGLTRLPPIPSRAFLSITGTDNTVIPAGSIVNHVTTGAEFKTENAVEIGVGFATGTATVFASASVPGEIEALSGTLSVIGTPVNGWDTVTNNVDATEGRLAETDSELRARRARSLSLAGTSSLASIVSAIQSIDNVSFAGAVENFTDLIDGNGLPPHSFECIVLGGDDKSIAQAIWEKKPIGIEPNGSVSEIATDIFGNPHTMFFSRPTSITIYLNANITFLGNVPQDADTVLTEAILNFVSGALVSGVKFDVGDDVINSRMYQPINITYNNVTINSLTLSTDGITFNASDIPIAFNELSAWDSSRITLAIG